MSPSRTDGDTQAMSKGPTELKIANSKPSQYTTNKKPQDEKENIKARMKWQFKMDHEGVQLMDGPQRSCND